MICVVITTIKKWLLKLWNLEVILDKKSKQVKKEKAARARKDKRDEMLYWKEEFNRIIGDYLKRKFKGSL